MNLNIKKIAAAASALFLIAFAFITPAYGAATVTPGFNFPNSSYSFQDNDIINAGDVDILLQWMGLRASTSTTDLSGILNNLSTAINAGSGLIPSSTFLKAANNLSDLLSTSSARIALGLADSATLPSSTWLKTANNLSDLLSTSTARTNIGLPDGSLLKTANNLSDLTNTSTARTNIGLNNTNQNCTGTQFVNGLSSTTTIQCSTLPAGLAPAGISGAVQINSGLGTLAGPTNFNFNASTSALLVGNVIAIPNTTSTVSTTALGQTFNVLGASAQTYTVPASTTIVSGSTSTITTVISSITFQIDGAQGCGGSGGGGGAGGESSGTLALPVQGTQFFAFVGQAPTSTSSTNFGSGAGFSNGGSNGCAGGGFSVLSTTSTTPSATSTFLLLAAGGGGGSPAGGGGAGGGLTGSDGGNTTPGLGATQTTGGAAGGTGGNPTSGSFLQGGSGENNNGSTGSGGGGGGLFGGGGGGINRGGGGGSAFISTTQGLSATSTVNGLNAGDGFVKVFYNETIMTTIVVDNGGIRVGGHLYLQGQNIASTTVSNCGGGATIIGSDEAGLITTGSSTLSCTLNFALIQWTAAPSCGASISSGTVVAFGSKSGTTSTIFTSASTLATSSKFNYWCFGYN